MKGSISLRSPGSWEFTINLGHDAFGRRRCKYATVRGMKSVAQRELRWLPTTLDRATTCPPSGAVEA